VIKTQDNRARVPTRERERGRASAAFCLLPEIRGVFFFVYARKREQSIKCALTHTSGDLRKSSGVDVRVCVRIAFAHIVIVGGQERERGREREREPNWGQIYNATFALLLWSMTVLSRHFRRDPKLQKQQQLPIPIPILDSDSDFDSESPAI